MTLFLDKKYINLVSYSLEKFKWKKNTLANCRCPICGDSEINKTKARGYFFQNDDAYFYKCHNCGISYNIYKFLEIVSPTLFKQYSLEKFTERNLKEIYVEEPKTKIEYKQRILSDNYKLIDQLPLDHKAIKFLELRKIPKEHWNKFYYTEHFAEFAKSVNTDYNLIDDDRIIIPINDEHNQFIGAQGRSFGSVKPKYITIKITESAKLIYGIERVNKSKPIIVVEGPIDSLFLPNAIACLGVGNFLTMREKFINQDLIFVLDNEPRNRAVVDTIKKIIEDKEKICIFPSSIKQKDINDMVLQGVDVYDIINQHTYSGASALLAFNTWRKC